MSRVNLRRHGSREIGKTDPRLVEGEGSVHIDAYFNDGWKDAILSRDKSIPFRGPLFFFYHPSSLAHLSSRRYATVNFAFHRVFAHLHLNQLSPER